MNPKIIHTIKGKLGLLVFSFLSSHLFAQQIDQAFLEASAEKGAQEFFYKNSRATSGGYTYVAGASLNDDGNYDMLLTKYSGATEVWSVSWNGSANGDDYAADVVVDGSGNIIICGATFISGVNYNAVVAKYNSSGTLQWSSTYAGGTNLADGFVSLEKDNSNNIYACGGTQTTSELVNYLTVKYNSSGTQQWASTYDYNDLYDAAVKIVVSGTTVRTSGGTQINSSDWQMTTVSYNTSSGTQGSVQHTGGDDEGVDKVTDAWTDGTYTYVVGSVRNTTTGYDWKVLKLNSDLEVVWSATYNGNASENDEAQSVKVDASSNVYVTGWATTTGEGKNFVTRKYNSSGTVQWTKTFNEESENLDDESLTLELDGSGHVLVSGSSYKDGNKDYFTIKYKYTDGTEVWRTRFNSDYNDDDVPSNIALDDAGNIYVIGTVRKGSETTTYMMCKYAVKTVYMPVPSDGFGERGYLENRTQVRNTDGSVNSAVKFYNDRSYPATYIEDSKISYVFGVLYPDSAVNDTLHRIDMKFNKGVHNAKVYPQGAQDYYTNFYLGYMTKNGERVYDNNSIVKFGVYTNTDVVFTQNDVGYKHWIVARSGAPTQDFELEYSGQTSLTVDGSGNLVIGTVLGNFTQPKAKAYTMNNTTGVLTELGWQPTYVVTGGNKVSFSYGSWSGTLVIEMMKGGGGDDYPPIGNLEWSTYYGDYFEDIFYTTIVDADENQFVCGSTRSPQFPMQVGSEFEFEVADQHSFWRRFDDQHVPGYGTFYGGSATMCKAFDMADDGEQIYLVGTTNATDMHVEAMDGADNDDTESGFSDGYIALFNKSDGHYIWSRYIGGSGLEEVRGIALDPPGCYWLTGVTGSNNFPTEFMSAGDNDDSFNGGTDGFVMFFNTSQAVVWSRYYGGFGQDEFYDIFIDQTTAQVYVAGVTTSSNFPLNNDGGSQLYNSSFDGDSEHFLIVTNNFANTELSTFIGGDDTEPIVPHFPLKMLEMDASDNLYYIGTTASTDLPDIYNFATWEDDTHNGGYDGFLFRIEATFFEELAAWSYSCAQATYIGGSDDEVSTTINRKSDGNLIYSGYTTSADVPTAEPGLSLFFEEEPLDAIGDAFIHTYQPDFNLIWGTYYGGTSYGSGERILGADVFNDHYYIVGLTDAYILNSGDVSHPLVDFGGDSYFQETFTNPGTYNYEGFISMFDAEGIPTGVEEQISSADGQLLLYPVPASNCVFVVLPNSSGMLNIYGDDGKLCLSTTATSKVSQIDIRQLANGFYTIVCVSDEIVLKQSFSIAR